MKTFEATNNRSFEKMSAFNWQDKRCYAAWLTQTYYFVRYSTRLLAMGAACCDLKQEELHKRMVSHLKEESGHDFLALKDIENLGFTPQDFKECHEIKSFYQTQFYLIQNSGAHELLGWICYLEGIAVKCGGMIIEKTAVHGPKSKRFLKLHAEEDVGHIESAFKVLQTLTPEQMKDVVDNYNYSAERYMAMLDWIAGTYKRQSQLSA